MIKRKWFKMTYVIIAAVLVLISIFARSKHISPIAIGVYDKTNQDVFSNRAINGIDPVAYFTEGKAITGDKSMVVEWNKAAWLFSSKENKNLFEANPEKYAPNYGGYCAFAVSKGFTANVDPEAWTILDDQLYLFAEPKFRDQFLEDVASFKVAADKSWSKVK